MVSRKELQVFIDSYLSVDTVDDYSYNGLQIEGKKEIHKVLFAVDSGIETFRKVHLLKGDMLIVHHGLFWKKQDPRLIGTHFKRVNALLKDEVSLYAVHLPLDMHEEIGNNVALVHLVGGEVTGRFSRWGSGYIGALGRLNEPISALELSQKLGAKLGGETKVLLPKKRITTIATMSGSAGRDVLQEAINLGVDCFITGEQTDIYHDAMDYGISVIFAGHHNSEQVGIWGLQQKVEEKFPSLECEYISIPTGL